MKHIKGNKSANIYAKDIDITILEVHEWKVFYLLVAKDIPLVVC